MQPDTEWRERILDSLCEDGHRRDRAALRQPLEAFGIGPAGNS